MFYFILIMIVVIFLIILYIKHRKPKKSTILCYGGGLGKGKSFNATEDAVRFIRKSRRKWKAVNYPFFSYLWLWIPYFNAMCFLFRCFHLS